MANYDTTARLITNIVMTAAFLAVTVPSFLPAPDVSLRNSVLFFFLPIAGMVWLLHPRYYFVSDAFIGIRRPFSTLRIPFTDILDIRSIEIRELGSTFRLFASGGLFGYLGLYHSSMVGRIMLWCTNKETLVIIRCKGKIVVISPEDPVRFVQEHTAKSRGVGSEVGKS
jgi:hypothetical protein